METADRATFRPSVAAGSLEWPGLLVLPAVTLFGLGVGRVQQRHTALRPQLLNLIQTKHHFAAHTGTALCRPSADSILR
jgi:hypothetical protein